MKKIIIALVLLVCSTMVFAFGKDDHEMTWAEYENICWSYGVEPSWEQYVYLLNNPTDLN